MKRGLIKEVVNDGIVWILSRSHESIQMIESQCYQFWVKEHPINQKVFRNEYPQFLTACLIQLETQSILKIECGGDQT